MCHVDMLVAKRAGVLVMVDTTTTPVSHSERTSMVLQGAREPLRDRGRGIHK